MLSGIVSIYWLITIPSGHKNPIFLGFTQQRLILIGLIFIGIIILLLSVVAIIKLVVIRKIITFWMDSKTLTYICGGAGAIIFILILIPEIEWREYGEIHTRLLPLLFWFGSLLLEWIALYFISKDNVPGALRNWMVTRFQKSKYITLILTALLAILYLLSTRVYGAAVIEDYWWETGVPILFWQVCFSLLISLFFIAIEQNIISVFNKRTEVIIFLICFIFFGLLWSSTRLTPSYFNIGPFTPKNVFYPYSDAARYDLSAQSTLLGYGFNIGKSLDRPFYPMFLALIHLLSGQDYSLNVTLQAFLFGFFPAIVYLLGKELGSRGLGIGASLMVGFWGWNTIIANNFINTSTPKQLLSDFPMAIILCLLLYFTIKWLKVGQYLNQYALITGGLISLAAYLRYSALLLLPFWLLAAILFVKPLKRNGLAAAGLIIIGFTLFTIPWYTRNIAVGQYSKMPFIGKISFIIHNRVLPLYENYGLADDTNSAEEGTSDKNLWNHSKYGYKEIIRPGLVKTLGSHLVHNVMSSLLILPTSLEIATLKTTVKMAGAIWNPLWDGTLPPIRVFLLLLQFSILTYGIVNLIYLNRKFTFMLVFLFIGIHLANSLGRTSGGRYIVPVEWIVLLFYLAGLLSIFGKITNKVEQPGRVQRKSIHIMAAWAIPITTLILLGATPVLFEKLTMLLFHQQNVPESIGQINGITREESNNIQTLINVQNNTTVFGYAFYPVHQVNKTTPEKSSTLEKVSITFQLVNPKEIVPVYFPYEGNIKINNRDQVYVIGCKVTGKFVANALIVIRNSKASYYQFNGSYAPCAPNS
jgi:hypothetical protein